jgi:hypothetical protein
LSAVTNRFPVSFQLGRERSSRTTPPLAATGSLGACWVVRVSKTVSNRQFRWQRKGGRSSARRVAGLMFESALELVVLGWRGVMRRRAVHAAVGLAAAVCVLGFPVSAFADTTVDFEQFAPGTTITNQYADLGGIGQGVVFGPLPGSAGGGLNPVIRTPPASRRAPAASSMSRTPRARSRCRAHTCPSMSATWGRPRPARAG